MSDTNVIQKLAETVHVYTTTPAALSESQARNIERAVRTALRALFGNSIRTFEIIVDQECDNERYVQITEARLGPTEDSDRDSFDLVFKPNGEIDAVIPSVSYEKCKLPPIESNRAFGFRRTIKSDKQLEKSILSWARWRGRRIERSRIACHKHTRNLRTGADSLYRLLHCARYTGF